MSFEEVGLRKVDSKELQYLKRVGIINEQCIELYEDDNNGYFGFIRRLQDDEVFVFIKIKSNFKVFTFDFLETIYLASKKEYEELRK